MGKGIISGAGVLLVASCLTGCAQLKQALRLEPARGETLEEVDSLLGRIEHVYIECERSEARVAEATSRLHKLVGTDFDSDAAATFVAFQEAIASSEQQAELLRASVEPLEKSASAFFRRWEGELNDFQSAQMRQRSEKRLTETRDRYKDIVNAVSPALPMYESFNAALSDHALYLQNDFNADAVSEIEGEVRAVTEVAKTLNQRFSDCREASRVYVERAALRGQLEPPQSSQPQSVEQQSGDDSSTASPSEDVQAKD